MMWTNNKIFVKVNSYDQVYMNASRTYNALTVIIKRKTTFHLWIFKEAQKYILRRICISLLLSKFGWQKQLLDDYNVFWISPIHEYILFMKNTFFYHFVYVHILFSFVLIVCLSFISRTIFIKKLEHFDR